MLLNYYTLRHLVDSWQKSLSGCRIVDVFSQTKDVLHIGLVSPSRDSFHLEICLDGKRAYAVLRSRQSRKGKNSVDLFSDLVGTKVANCILEGTDRQIKILLDSGRSIVIRLYGSMNLFLLSTDRTIIDSFKDSKTLTGELLTDDPRNEEWRDESAFVVSYPSAEAFDKAIHGGLAGFSRTLGTELSWRMRDTVYEPLDAYRRLHTFVEELSTSPLRIYHRYDEPYLLSPIALNHLAETLEGLRETSYDDPNEAVLEYVIARATFDVRNYRREAVVKTCKNRLRKHRVLLKKLQGELDHSLQYEKEEQKANLLTMNHASLKRGMAEIEIEDIYHDGVSIHLTLDPSMSPQENAARLYTRARKMKKAVDNLQKRMIHVAADIERERKIADSLSDDGRVDWKTVDTHHAEFLKLGWLQVERENTKAVERSTFREFCVSGNWRVFVGQNDKKNDELTFQFAHKNDLWFHARGVPGSHVLLKRDGRKDNPSKRSIEEAASIAAFYSKSKTSSLVSVIMTERKYVRKRKGLRPGQVIVEREEVVMVEPADPKDLSR